MHRNTVRGIALVCVLFALNAVAQTGQSAGGASDAPASTPASPKAIRAANRALAAKVLKTLARIKGLDATGIFVKASDGNIMLSGVVQTSGQIPLAVQAATDVDGVKSVQENLRLAKQPTQ
ncbi:BON domain-containing protein [Pararobbsia silviterrae]|uniref:BON domain-containing protein n=1 Tax=Pararobbsia silviterrae TaxID=1792498 RepID=A0A494XZF1_9BURK|nr:BON domain-containing protein [Pararobbsia silviterrae]RKP53556.1 BON domain-containing protein [Pararobbsia silviterrae]